MVETREIHKARHVLGIGWVALCDVSQVWQLSGGDTWVELMDSAVTCGVCWEMRLSDRVTQVARHPMSLGSLGETWMRECDVRHGKADLYYKALRWIVDWCNQPHNVTPRPADWGVQVETRIRKIESLWHSAREGINAN